ncbi:MAG: hypothetical protein ACR2O3_17895 [Rhizobiaceae bacterium]
MFPHFSILLTTVMAITALSAASAIAETFWLSEPGLCDADEGVIEEMDIMYLTKTGISSHWFSCEWPLKAGQSILQSEAEVSTNASCANATGTWKAELTIVPQGDSSVKVHQESGGMSPVRFFHCD